MPDSIPREKRSESSAGVVGALPGRSRGRPAPRGRGLGPQSRAHRLYFQGPFFLPSPDLRREGKRDVCVYFWPAFLVFVFSMRDATGKHLRATHTGSDSPNTKHTLEHGVKHILKDKISSAVSLCLFRYALPLAAFVVDAALLVGSMMFFVSYEFICNVHDAYTTIAA